MPLRASNIGAYTDQFNLCFYLHLPVHQIFHLYGTYLSSNDIIIEREKNKWTI